MKLKALIIDDDQTVIDFIVSISKLYFANEIEIIASYNNGLEAIENIENLNPDVIFLDVEMPEFNGFEIKELIPSHLDTKVVIISGKEGYALKAIKNSVFDFLTKPIAITDFRSCINRLTIAIQNESNNSIHTRNNEILVVNRQDKALFIEINTINRIEASGAYTTIFYGDNLRIRTTKSLTYHEKILSKNNFFKIHRSCLVNVSFIKEVIKTDYEGTIVLKDGTKLLLSKAKKDTFLRQYILSEPDQI